MRVRAALIALTALATVSCGSQPSSHRVVRNADHPCRGAAAPASYEHVVLVVLENHSYDQVAHASPYLNELAHECGLASNYDAITHPSLPNYLALTSGTTAGIRSDCTDCSSPAPSIFGQLGADWRTYAESLPSAGFQGSSSGDYAKKHNPAAYFPAIAAAYARNAVPLSPETIRSLARFTVVVPNLCNDEHDCSLDSGDRWLAAWIPRILRSPAYKSGSTSLLVTYDEGTLFDSHVYTVVVAPSVTPGTVATASFDHYSLLRTIEKMLGLSCLANACKASAMDRAFHLLGSHA